VFCIIALFIQHANRIFSASYYSFIRCLSGSIIFFHFLINGMIFGNTLLNMKRVLFPLQILFETFLILRKIQQDTIINVGLEPTYTSL
jgi:UDP-N-acetylglucosamine:LPS N-acetylglucosamine transferase